MIRSRLKTCLLLLLLIGSTQLTRAQLAGGTYTINSGAATGGTNYASFTAAIAAMSSGVTGPVVFNVVSGSGPYTEQVSIGAITGASATNTIKFNGNGAIVQYTPTATNSGVLMMNGTKYVKFDSLTFKGQSATYGSGAILYNACDRDSITRCTFDLTALTATTSTNYGLRISTTASTTSSTASGATNTYIGRNTFSGPTGSGGAYYCFYNYGPNTGNIYDKNTLSNFYLYGIYDYYATNITYNGNIITRETKTSVSYCYGLYVYNGGAGIKVNGNVVKYLGGTTAGTTYCYPFNVMYGTGTVANPILVSNNVITNMTLNATYGIRFSYNVNANLYHNTVNLDIPVAYSGTTNGLYQVGNDSCNVKNNIISITGGGTSTIYGNYFSANTNHTSDKNDVYVNSTQTGTQNYGYLTSAFTTLAAFQAANAPLEANGLSVNPQFTAPAGGNLKPTSSAVVAVGANLLSFVATDILGTARATAPTLGAYEVALVSNNASLTSIANPSGNFCSGTQPVKVTVSNSGSNNITSMQINWALNGVAQTPYSYTGTLTTGQSTAAITIGNGNFTAGANTLKVWTSLPNNTVDNDPSNDTVTTTLTTSTFTVTASKDTICSSSTSILNLSPSTGYSTGALEWQSSPNGTTWTTIANTDNVSYSASGLTATTQYRAHVITGGTGCYAPAKTITLINPQILTSTPATKCGSGTLNLAATASAGSTIKWYDGPATTSVLGTGATFTTPSLTATTTYYVAASTATTAAVGKITPVSTSGNSGFSDVGLMFDAYSPFTLNSVDVYPISTTSTAGTVTIALKNSSGTVLQSTTANVVVGAAPGVLNTVPLNFSVPAGTGYRLVVTAATGMTTLNRESSTTNFSYPYTLAGVCSITSAYTGGASSSYYYYFYNWQVSSGCDGTRTPVVATITTAPTITAAATATTICNGSNANISVSSANSNYTYSWSSGQSTASFQATPTATTKYVVHAVDAATTCNTADSVTVTVITQTAAITPSATQNICTGTTTTLTATTGSNLSYQWYNGASAVNGATGGTYTTGVAGAYTVRVTNTVTGCVATSSPVTVNLVPPPTATITSSATIAICPGSQTTLTAATGAGYTYQWLNSGATSTGTSTGSSYTTAAAGTYTVAVSANGCTVVSAPAVVSLLPLPIPQMSPNTAASGCDSVVLTTSQTGLNYQWNYNTFPILNATSSTYAASASGNYSLTVSSPQNGCAATTSAVAITVNAAPAAVITYSTPVVFCEGGAVVLTTYDVNNVAYQWYNGTTAIAGASDFAHIASATGLYSVRLTDIANGCTRATQPILVKVNPLPAPVTVYNNATNELSTTQPFVTYQWSLNGQPINNAQQQICTPTQNGAYSVTVSDTNGCMNVSPAMFVSSLGVQATPLGTSLKIYPNPTTDELHVTAAETVQLTLRDVTGKAVLTGSSDHVLHLGQLANGMYLLYITNETGQLIRAEKITKIGY